MKGQYSGASFHVKKVRKSKNNCYTCKNLKGDYCKKNRSRIKSISRGSCSNYQRDKHKKNRKVKCTNCYYFKFDYYCDKKKEPAPYRNRRKYCNGYKKK